MSDPGRLHGLSAIALKSTSRIDRPSNTPTEFRSIEGAEGGAVAGGRVDVSIPSSGSLDADWLCAFNPTDGESC